MTQSIFPTEPSAPDPDREPRFVPLEDAGDMVEALASRTARRIVDSVWDDPKTPSDIADSVETSIQNALYHLERLVDAGVLEVVDTCYSPRGREMSVYAPASGPVVICVGGDSVDADVAGITESRLRTSPEFADSD
jgi:DNA-binding transcriptional ArsR family regulator